MGADRVVALIHSRQTRPLGMGTIVVDSLLDSYAFYLSRWDEGKLCNALKS